MANPQPEDGVTRISNEILEALWKINLSSYETRVLLYLIRKTYGWHKKTEWIALSLFAKEIGIDRRLIHRTLKSLSSKGIILVIPQDDKKRVYYGFQKDYDKWNLSSPKMTHKTIVIPQDDKTKISIGNKSKSCIVSSLQMTTSGVISTDDGLSSPEIPIKETIIKENYITSSFSEEFLKLWVSYPKKVGKQAAWKAWLSAKKKGILPPIETIIQKLTEQKKSDQWTKEKGQFIPNPTTWINQGRWDDEIPKKKW